MVEIRGLCGALRKAPLPRHLHARGTSPSWLCWGTDKDAEWETHGVALGEEKHRGTGARVEVISIRTASLGDATYIAVHGDNAIVVDPQRDVGRFTDILDDRGLTLTHVLETHMHNDYISGGRDLAKARDADLVLPAASGAAFPFVPAFHNEEFDAESGLVVRALHTPGHTPEHTSYLVLIDGEEQAVFTGGSLLVGSAGRPDLLGFQYARQLARLQYGSLQRLGRLPDETGVFPTHGEGSFCTASGAGRTTSTIGREKEESPLYQIDRIDAFVENQLSALVPYPRYYAHMGPTNKQDPTAVEITSVPELSPFAASDAISAGAAVIDGRSRVSFSEGRLIGSIGIELGDSFAPWVGWLVDYNTPLVLVLDDKQDAVFAATELSRIGFTKVRGVLRGIGNWEAEELPVATHRIAPHTELFGKLDTAQILDVRDPLEWEAGHIAGSIHCYLPDINKDTLRQIDTTRDVWVICESGSRASIAAGLLARFGIDPIVIASGGVADVLRTSAG